MEENQATTNAHPWKPSVSALRRTKYTARHVPMSHALLLCPRPIPLLECCSKWQTSLTPFFSSPPVAVLSEDLHLSWARRKACE